VGLDLERAALGAEAADVHHRTHREVDHGQRARDAREAEADRDGRTDHARSLDSKAAAGSASCRYCTSKSAKGKTLRGKVAFSARGTKFTKPFAAKLG
jgi:hypothetical protein